MMVVWLSTRKLHVGGIYPNIRFKCEISYHFRLFYDLHLVCMLLLQ